MDNRVPDRRAWLEPDRWDRLPVLGVGAWSRVLAAGRYALKVAHPGPRARKALRREVQAYAAVKETPAAPLAPRLYASRADGRAHLREKLRGPSLLERIRAGEPDIDWTAFGEAHARAEAHHALTGRPLDFSPANLFYARGSWVLCDLGERLADSPFEGRRPDELAAALERYLEERAEFEGRVQAFLPPPSGRFHVEVPVGRVLGARVLWRNERLRAELDLAPYELGMLSNLTTSPRVVSRTCVATRYQDGPRKADAHGDGRVVFVGEKRGHELTAKGVGPTPLAWRGVKYHEDGRVSFNRTLWEASVCDELERLGFEAPRVLAITEAGATTVDNTERAWPAAVSLRASRTHYRAGHLHRVDHKPAEFRDLLAHVGARLEPGFDVTRAAHVERFFWRFTTNLADDVGRTEALNIRCFNPTMGNVRLDGHLIDFSTVRFFDRTYTDFVYMNGRRLSREHTATLRRHATELLACLRRGQALDEARFARMSSQLPARFERAHFRGYLDGVSAFLGVRLAPHAGKARGQSLVRALRRLRELRGPGEREFRFWNQRCQAPLFDLEHNAAAWLSSGEPVDLLLDRGAKPDRFGWHCAREAHAHLRALVDVARARPRRWEEIVRPVMELEALAALCYERSSPEDLDEWARSVAR